MIRNNRFNEGALMGAFESGDFPKIIDRFVRLRTAALPADAVPVQGDGSLVIRHRTGLSRVTVLPHHFSHALAARLGHEAVEAIEKVSYRGPNGQQVGWADEVRAAVRAKESIPPEFPLAVPEPSSSATGVEVTNESTLEAARRLTDAGKRPLVLNFANGVHPGGGLSSTPLTPRSRTPYGTCGQPCASTSGCRPNLAVPTTSDTGQHQITG